MTVQELIEVLSKLDPALTVYVRDPGCGCCSSGDEELSGDPEIIDVRQPSKWVKVENPKPFEDHGKWVEQPSIKGVRVS